MFEKLKIQKTRPDPNRVLLVLTVCVFLLGMATKAEVENVKEAAEKDTVADTLTQPENKTENSYRIEVGKVKLRGEEEEEIRFISPEGKVMRTINKYHYKTSISETKGQWNTEINHVEAISEKKNAVLLWKCNYSTNYNPQGKEGPHGSKRDYEVKVLNGRGEESLVKNFTVYPTGYLAIPFWSTGISKDGSTVYVYYRDSSDVFHVDIYDTKGEKLTSVTYPHEFKADMQISPDGKIFGAETFKEGKGKHLFFLNVETGETKVLKAEGKGWAVDFALPYEMGTPLGKIYIGWGIYGDNNNREWVRGGHSYLTFEQLPEDLSTLFGG